MESGITLDLGNYRLLRLLGQGGSGDIYLGEQIYLKTQVAVKMLRTRVGDEQLSSFLTQARIIAGLEHPHIVRTLDCDIKNGTPFLVMQYIPGGNLRQHFPKGTQAPLTEVLTLAKQAASALDYMHQVGHIHGDVKPENLLLNEQGELLISDFGLQLVNRQSPALQKPTHIGTIAYMAPEQIQGNLCPASDQYALGIVLYEWLCGEPPFHGTFAEIATQHALIAPEPLRPRRPDISPQMEHVVLRALAKDPEQRFATVQDFTAALEQASKETSVASAPRHIARRTLLLAGLGGIAITSGSLIWVALSQQAQAHHLHSVPVLIKPTPTTIERALFIYQQHSPIYCLAWSPDGMRIATGEQDTTIHIWQATASSTTALGSLLFKISLPTSDLASETPKFAIKCLAWASDSARLAFGYLDTIQVWDFNTKQELAILNGATTQNTGNGLGTTVVWSPDGTQIACGGISTSASPQVTLLHLPSGQTTISMPPNPPNALNRIPASTPLSLAWSPDGTSMAIGLSEQLVNVWRLSDGSLISRYQGHQGGVSTLAWSPNGQYIASSCGFTIANPNNIRESTVHIWKVTTGERILMYTGHKASINALAWSPDGNYLASGSGDQTVQIWHTTTGQTVHTYRGHTAEVTAVSWSSDGTRVAAASEDGTTWIWQV